MNAEEYNLRELAAGRITPVDITRLVREFQMSYEDGRLLVDGKFGPKTRAALVASADDEIELEPLIVDESGWLVGHGVVRIPADRTWYPIQKAAVERRDYGLPRDSRSPRAIVWHYTATNPGTARVMANRRVRPLSEEDRVASWHVSIETDGTLVQMIPFVHGAWHVRQNCPAIPGAGKASLSAVGVELVGHGKDFPEAQVTAAKRLGRALVRAYPVITPERFGVTHKELDPDRRNDPGPVWAARYAGPVKEYAYES